MADVQKQFKEFDERIRLKQYSENKPLREKRDIVLDKLRAGLERVFEEQDEPPPTFEKFDQGSYKLGTGVKPLDGDYDIDVGIRFEVSTDDEPDPVAVKKWVFDALDGHTKKVEVRRPCVTVTYQSAGEPLYHVDLAVYSGRSSNSDGLDYLGKGKLNSQSENREWEKADPDGLIDTITARYSGDEWEQFRRCIRYLKRWKDYKFSSDGNAAPIGIGITLAAYYWFQPRFRVVDPFSGKRAAEDLKALDDFVAAIESHFSNVYHDNEWAERLVVELPVVPSNDVFARMTNSQMSSFREKLGKLKDALSAARAETDPVVACEGLQKIFGGDFPVPEKDDTGEKKSRAVIASSHSG
jgi:hypothetical protein